MGKKIINCKTCSKEIASSAKTCPNCGAKNKKPIYKRWWFIVIVLFIIVEVLSGSGNDNYDTAGNEAHVTKQEVSQNQNIDEKVPEEETVPTEYKSALKKAQSYSDMMHMSKAGLYEQLTSEYGEKFTAEAAQYAIDISLTIFTHSLTYLIKHQLCGLENDSYTKNHLFGIFFCI